MRTLHRSLLLLAAAALSMRGAAAQAVSWPSAQGGNDHWYEAVYTPAGIDWASADVSATLAGGHLATLTSAAENQFASDLVQDPKFWYQDGAGNSLGPWLGAYQPPGSPEPAGGWTWVTGEPWSFTAWSPGEPNNWGGAEHHLQFFGGGYPNYAATWNDVPGAGPKFGYVVEYDGPPVIGTNYCTANANSTGVPARIAAEGSAFVTQNALRLRALDLPLGSFGFFVTSRVQAFIPNPGGSSGNLCVGGSIGRYVGPGQVKNSGAQGEFSLTLDLTLMPTPTGLVVAQAGETWNFTAWFRDAIGGVATSNLTDGVEVTLY